MNNSGNSNANNNNLNVLNNIEIQHAPYAKKNEATLNAENDIFGGPSNNNTNLFNAKILYTAAGVSIENSKPATTINSSLPNNPPHNSAVVSNNTPLLNTSGNTNNNTSNNHNIVSHTDHHNNTPQPHLPSNIPPSSSQLTQIPITQPPVETPKIQQNIQPTPIEKSVLPQTTPTQVVHQPEIVPPTPLPLPSVQIQKFNISPHIMSMTSPCVENSFIPPRDGGFVETPKVRMMQEKLFIRWINYYVSQRGVFVENLAHEFADGVVFIHLLECYTRVLISDEMKAYCTPFPSSDDEKYLNFYSGFAHLAYLQKPIPPVDILSLYFFFLSLYY